MNDKQTLFFAASALAILTSITGCKEDQPKDPDRKFENLAECQRYYGHSCLPEETPIRLSASNTPLFVTQSACEAAFGPGNCASTTIRSAKQRTDQTPDNFDVDLSDPLWEKRIEGLHPEHTLNEDTVLWYPVRRSHGSGGSYAYTNNHGHANRYYGGGPHFVYYPIFLNGGGPSYVLGNPGRVALNAPQTASAGPRADFVGKAGPGGGIGKGASGGAPSGSGAAPSGGSGGSIGSGAGGKAGGFGGTAGSGGSGS